MKEFSKNFLSWRICFQVKMVESTMKESRPIPKYFALNTGTKEGTSKHPSRKKNGKESHSQRISSQSDLWF